MVQVRPGAPISKKPNGHRANPLVLGNRRQSDPILDKYYQEYSRWCRQIGVTPANYETYRKEVSGISASLN